MIPTLSANGAVIPALGLGTWRLRDEVAVGAVHAALDAGCRHIDTAAVYDNEAAVGEALRSHAVPRAEIFVTTKVWYTDVADGALQRSAEASLKRLGLDRVDLLLIHWPSRDVTLGEQIGALCDARRRGLARHVGLSNFTIPLMEEAVRLASEPLVANQVEHHPLLDQRRLLAACRRLGMAMVSYSPLGKGGLLDEPAITAIAAAHARTPAQVVLRWHLQQPGNGAIPRSSRPERIAENFDVSGFALSAAEMARISGLARPDGRLGNPSWAPDWDAPI